MMKKVIVLTGAGISAESGINTFRAVDGLWENHRVEDVASPIGWQKNPQLVLDFYNERRSQINSAHPNAGHQALVDLEKAYEVIIITQNVDDLHERAGSSKVLHLHGEILRSRSTVDESLIYECPGDINLGDHCEKGSQLRPHIVWFGEMVPMMETAATLTSQADVLMIVGTSMAVYPAASLVNFVTDSVPKYLIDPNIPAVHGVDNLTPIEAPATVGVPQIVSELLKRASR